MAGGDQLRHNALMLTSQTLLALLSYDPFTGCLTWRERAIEWFKTPSAAKTWNKRFANKPAFTSTDAAGYRHGNIFGKPHYAHRVIWCMCFGYWPIEVDHENGDRSDNRLLNLINGSHHQNMKNIKRRTDNSSGHTGVVWEARRNKWNAKVQVNGRNKHLGYFDKIEDAVLARQQADQHYSFHSNHGKPR